ncbi:hypothetical protein CLV56_3866 [Mumia flava]|uniref:Uncharacterized protein n=1 Tax=Mumia flava TaxID=1348852 RepID=A0A2M9B8X0_9ACTN|nr:hypothetical protein [Mumia flava]PJJ54357.1 hypothetical protein CLV56_3866 [Mumia flava]
MHRSLTRPLGDESGPAARRPAWWRTWLSWTPALIGIAAGVFQLVSDPHDLDGILTVLLLATGGYAVIAYAGRPAWSWPLLAVVVAIHLAGELLPVPGIALITIVTLEVVVLGAIQGRWRPPPREQAWQGWAGFGFIACVLSTVWLDTGAAVVVVAIGLLAHGAWDIVHLRRRVVVAPSMAQWCAGLDITLGAGALAIAVVG